MQHQTAETDNLIAEAKEDLGSTEAELLENKKYLANLNKMCAEGDAAFEKRTAPQSNMRSIFCKCFRRIPTRIPTI